MACRAAEHTTPEHEPLHFLPTRFTDALVADFAVDDRHARRAGVRLGHEMKRVGNAAAIPVAGLQHIEIQ